MTPGQERLVCPPPSTELQMDKSRLIRSHKVRRERTRSRNQRARTKLSLIIVSVILVPIAIGQIQPTLSQVPPISKPQAYQPPGRATSTSQNADDWTRRLRGANRLLSPSSNERQDELASAQVEHQQQQVQLTETDLAAHANNQPPLWLRALNGDQQSPLGRALEATRVFVRQQQALGGQTQAPRFPLIQSLVAAGRGNGDLMRFAQQAPGALTSSGGPNTTTAGRLMQFLFQPKSAASNSNLFLPQPVSRQQQVATTRNNTPPSDPEPIQSAASEHFYEQTVGGARLPMGAWPHRLLKGGRSLVTLSAPYEQGPRTLNSSLFVGANRSSRASDAQRQVAAAATMSGRPLNLIAAASGNHHMTTSFSYADGSPVEDPPAVGVESSAESGPSDAALPGQEPNQAQEVYYLEQQAQAHEQQQQQQEEQPRAVVEMSQEEAEQQQQEQQQSQANNDASTQWNATSQLFESSPNRPPDGAPDLDQQQDQTPEAEQQQAQANESSQLPGEEPHRQQHQQQQQEIQLHMNANGELFEGPGSDVSFGQRPALPVTSNETGSYLQLSYEPSLVEPDRKSNNRSGRGGGGDEGNRNRLSNLTTSYLLPVAATNGSGRDSSPSSVSNLLVGDEGSLAAAHLPSQYESIIRMPPEGHYDDYFKPLGAGGGGGEGGDEPGRFVPAPSSATADFRAQQQNETGEQQQAVAGANRTAHDADSQYQYFMNQQQMFADQQHRHNPPPLAPANAHHAQQERPFEDVNSSHAIQYETQGTQRQQPPQLYQIVYQQQRHQHRNETSQPSLSSNQQIAVSQFQQTSNSSGATSAATAATVAAGGGNSSAAEPDNIQLIVANSAGNLQDPQTHEKVITYTSEAGRNFARLIGKPARHTFYNKDLNESPAPGVGATPSATSNAPPTSSPALAAAKFRSTRSPEYPTPTQQTGRPALALPGPTQRSDELGDEELSGGLDVEEVGGPATLPAGLFGQYATSGQLQRQANGGLGYRAGGGGGRGQPARNHRSQQQQQQPASDMVRAPRNHRGMAGGRAQQTLVSNKLARHPAMLSKQQSVGRPQVTEAKFELKELPLNAPTAMPSVGASTVKSIAELPTKVKRLRDHQVDKNELMNELLTALDRVKAAIYKLQPLTAKMNAMYRKSVTSNTRDQILDNNKGTYSKRYPPGDFDDTYDRMHPSELLEHQQRLSSRGGEGGSGSEGRSARLNRAASGGTNSTLAGGGARRERNRPARHDLDDQDSKTMAVYLPAPDGFGRPGNGANPTGDGEQIVASGTGRRFGGKLRGRLSLRSSSGGQIIYDDDGADDDERAGDHLLGLPSKRALSKRSGDQGLLITDEGTNSTTGGGFSELQNSDGAGDGGAELAEGGASPLFGYRITIYQSPELSGDSETPTTYNDSQTEEANPILSYSLIDDGRDGASADAVPPTGSRADQDDELMATSESSVVTTPKFDDDNDDGDGDRDRDTSESSGGKRKKVMMDKRKKSGKEEVEEEKGKRGRESEQRKGNKWSKHEKRGKKGEEEHKKKKEFKKIKHHKGLMSKESHKLHRDKHIKAHDRGAAKEKALKERTQIEFFEREQIVDDEFEKGKKSTMKAGWASGHDAKRSSLELGDKGHDSMTMGGSHYVGQLESPPAPVSGSGASPAAAASAAQPMLMAASEHGDSGGGGKGQGHSSESSSGKQSNKFEKKQMEARGKKFKGWREKGYKIITETEFIDRGSLHDSAYKKRDKGAAHHQKFKKHEAKSEGHQGSMHEHHKKSHKREEKKTKMEEKKKELSGKEGEEANAKKRKRQHEEEKKKRKEKKEAQEGGDHDQEESAPTMSSVGDTGELSKANRKLAHLSVNNTSGYGQATTLRPTVLMVAATTTFKPRAGNRASIHFDGADGATLARHRYVITPSSVALDLPSSDNASRRSDHLSELKTQAANRKSAAALSNSHRHQANNFTLPEIINRLNSGQARARAEASSPLLRLVSTLANLESQKRQLSAAAATSQQASSSPKHQVLTQLTGANPRQQQQQQQHRTTNHNERPPIGVAHQPSLTAGHQSAFVQQNAPLLIQAHRQPQTDQIALPLPQAHFSPDLRPTHQNSNAVYRIQRQPEPQIYLQPPLLPSAAYLPQVATYHQHHAAAASESSPYSFMADSQVNPIDALANFEPFDYEQPADSQQQQQQLPSQLQAPRHHDEQLHQFNFLTDQR